MGNFALSFANRYIENRSLAPDRKLLIIRAAVGGTGFIDKRWGMEDDLYLRMMEMIKTALALNPANKIKAILWHQGETDSYEGNTIENHYTSLKTLVDSIHQTFNCPEVPFICGDFVNPWRAENLTNCLPVLDAMRKLCADLSNAAFIETTDLESNSVRIGNDDTIHFCREALNILGNRYYEAYARLKG